MQKIKHQRQRRQFLHDTFTGLSGIALASLMQRDGLVANEFTHLGPGPGVFDWNDILWSAIGAILFYGLHRILQKV